MTELRNCPFCGTDSKANKVHLARRHNQYKVVCSKCGACGRTIPIKGKLTENELFVLQRQAIEAWNKRV